MSNAKFQNTIKNILRLMKDKLKSKASLESKNTFTNTNTFEGEVFVKDPNSNKVINVGEALSSVSTNSWEVEKW